MIAGAGIVAVTSADAWLVAAMRRVGAELAHAAGAAPRCERFGPELARSLGEGDAGLVLLDVATGRRDRAARARRVRLVGDDSALDATFVYGRLGLAVVRAHAGLPAAADAAELDERLALVLGAAGPGLGAGLLNGAAGIGMYALTRPRRAGRALAQAFLAWLERTLDDWPDGARQPEMRLTSGFGLAGGAAVAALLGQRGLGGRDGLRVARAAGARVAEALALGDRAWQDDGWWKGRLGVAAALYQAAALLDAPALARTAVALAAEVLAVDVATVTEPSLGRGAAGIAHLLRRFHEATGQACFRDGADRWFRRTLALARAADVAARPGLLLGGAGIALALLSAAGAARDDWDAALLGGRP
jgi:hypothetical protein